MDLADILKDMRHAGHHNKGVDIAEIQLDPRRDGRMSLVVHSGDGSAIWSVEDIQAALAYFQAWVDSPYRSSP